MPLTLVLSVGLDASLLKARNVVLHSAGYLVESASSLNEAAHRFLAGDFDLVILCHSVSTRERERMTCLIRASGSLTPIVSISGNLCQCDAFVTATIEDGPNFLIDIRVVLNREAGAWTVLPGRAMADVTGKPQHRAGLDRQAASSPTLLPASSSRPFSTYRPLRSPLLK
jgi:CheY-like chemotaxis protein